MTLHCVTCNICRPLAPILLTPSPVFTSSFPESFIFPAQRDQGREKHPGNENIFFAWIKNGVSVSNFTTSLCNLQVQVRNSISKREAVMTRGHQQVPKTFENAGEFRMFIYELTESKVFSVSILFVILLNTVILVIQTDEEFSVKAGWY